MTGATHSLSTEMPRPADIAVPGPDPGAPPRAYRLLIAGILLIAVLLRFVALDRYPLPMHQDELTDVYDGYSLWTTGADRFGDAWPTIFRGMGPGDYHPGLYAYLSLITTAVAGFSVWAGRFPAAVAGALTVWLVYCVARRQFGPRGGVLAILFAAFSPIHVLYSRQAHTGLCIQPLFAVLMLYMLQRTLDNIARSPRIASNLGWTALLGLVIGFSTNVYGAMRLSALLFAVLGAVSLIVAIGWRQGAWKHALVALIVFAAGAGVGAAPQLYAMVTRETEFFARASTVVYPLAYGPRWWAMKLTHNMLSNLDPRYLFLSFGECSDMTVVRLGIVSLPFLYAGFGYALVQGLWNRRAFAWLLLISVVIFLMPAAASKPNPNAMRSSGVWALYPLVSAWGALGLAGFFGFLVPQVKASTGSGWLSPQWLRQCGGAYATAGLGLAIVGIGLFNVARYIERPDLQGAQRQNHLVRLGEWLGEHGRGYDRIYVDTEGIFTYFYLAAFSGMTPAEFQKAPREGIVTKYGWERFRRFGPYRFATLKDAMKDWAASSQDESWLVLHGDGSFVEIGAPVQAARQSIPRTVGLARAPGSDR